MPQTFLSQQKVLLGIQEVVFRTTPTMAMADDAFLTINPDINTDITVLDRQNSRGHISPLPGNTGRKISTLTFQHEARGSGNHATTAPALGRLLKWCGMAEVNHTTTLLEEALSLPPTYINAVDQSQEVSPPTADWTAVAEDTAYAGDVPRTYVLQCTKLGASAEAEFYIYSPASGTTPEISAAGGVITTAATFDLEVGGGPAFSITPTFTGDFIVGDTYIINVTPDGYSYVPVSTGWTSASFRLHTGANDGSAIGQLQDISGCRGTFSCEGNSGQYALFSFTFTGDYNRPAGGTIATGAVYEDTVPPQVELAAVALFGGRNFKYAQNTAGSLPPNEVTMCAQSFSFDMANEVVSRECINEANGLGGAEIVGRAPVATFDPQMLAESTGTAFDLADSFTFWKCLEEGSRCFFTVKVGTEAGNTMVMHARHAQISGITTSDRNNIMVYDTSMTLGASDSGVGNDEIVLTFC